MTASSGQHGFTARILRIVLNKRLYTHGEKSFSVLSLVKSVRWIHWDCTTAVSWDWAWVRPFVQRTFDRDLAGQPVDCLAGWLQPFRYLSLMPPRCWVSRWRLCARLR